MPDLSRTLCCTTPRREKVPHGKEEELVDWYRELPLFYSLRVEHYKNSTMKRGLFDEKAEEIGMDSMGSGLKRWFQSIWTQFKKLAKGPPCGAAAKTLTAREAWILDQFSFLKGHIRKFYSTNKESLTNSPSGLVEVDESEAPSRESEVPSRPSTWPRAINQQGWPLQKSRKDAAPPRCRTSVLP